MNSNKLLVFATSTRSDYARIEPLASAAFAAGFQVELFVTGLHMVGTYGLTKMETRVNRLFSSYEFVSRRETDAESIVLSRTISGFADYIHSAKPNLVIVLGPSIEALGCALATSTEHVPLVFIDEYGPECIRSDALRHSIATVSCAILNMGISCPVNKEENGVHPPVFHIGSPEVDRYRLIDDSDISQVMARYQISSAEYGICHFDPMSPRGRASFEDYRRILQGLQATRKYFVVFLPENTIAYQSVRELLLNLPSDSFRVLPSMRAQYFSELVMNARCIIGDSRIAIIHAPLLGIPSLSIAHYRPIDDIIDDITGDSFEVIKDKVNLAWTTRYASRISQHEVNAAESFIKHLNSQEFWETCSVAIQLP